MMIRVADYVTNRLYEEGIKHIFLVTGRGILYLSDAVAKHEHILPVSVHHEQAAAYAAVAYAQYKNMLGACLITTGCGSTNAVTGVLNAWQDGVPCVFLSGQHKLKETVRHMKTGIRTYGSQESDIIPIVESITKYAVMLEDPEKIAYELDKAIHLATTGRRGPVWVDIPIDVQNMRVDPDKLERYLPEMPRFTPSADDIHYVADAWNRAKRPVILIGNGIRASESTEALRKFVEEYSIPVTFACSSVDTYGIANKLSIGAVGSIGGSRAGNFTVQNADLLLVLGCRLSPLTTGSEYHKFARAANILVVDIDEIEHAKNTVRIDRLIKSDVKEFLARISEASIPTTDASWVEKCLHWKNIFPTCEEKYKSGEKIDLYDFSNRLSAVLERDAVLLCDAGLEEVIIPSAVRFQVGQRCLHPYSQGSMGAALPGAIGAYYACGHPVTAVIGDGSIMMNLQELQTIVHYHIPVRIVVINNNAYSVIRTRQKDLFRTRTIGTDPSNGVSCPDFQKVAACFGIPYMAIKEKEQLDAGLKTLMHAAGPIICEVLCEEDQGYICNSHALNAQKRIVNRPLEDQYPYMDRALFTREMVVEPIDQ